MMAIYHQAISQIYAAKRRDYSSGFRNYLPISVIGSHCDRKPLAYELTVSIKKGYRSLWN
ncbi:hypothetical protein [uncultured Gammaproteobacteria bacterium]|nr:hypothetical protein [uncultured Gammaproteobacteria bacterium]